MNDHYELPKESLPGTLKYSTICKGHPPRATLVDTEVDRAKSNANRIQLQNGPYHFRSMNAVPGISGGRASGSAQFSGTELLAMHDMLDQDRQPRQLRISVRR